MKKALILYQSKTGITAKFGEEISKYIAGKGIETTTTAVKDYRDGMTDQADYLFLGCWTAGFMLLFQHPDLVWKQFAHKLPGLSGKKIVLFTTYKIATGSMFKSMKKHLGAIGTNSFIELKSRKGDLSEENKKVLEELLK
jgi:flavodoxin